VLQRRKWFQNRSIRGTGIRDISWFTPGGQEMSDADWATDFVKSLGVRLAGDLIGHMDERGEPVTGDTLLLLLNAHHEAVLFTLPPLGPEHRWEPLLDTAGAKLERGPIEGAPYPLQARSFAVLRASPLP
jgi:glycogen operon protein